MSKNIKIHILLYATALYTLLQTICCIILIAITITGEIRIKTSLLLIAIYSTSELIKINSEKLAKKT